ncbi:MAG: M28 family peptidase [Putridiphycobacter sp.]
MPKANTQFLVDHLTALVETEKPRFFRNFEVLDSVAAYIHQAFSQYTTETTYQVYKAGETDFKNVICSLGNLEGPRIIVGAHYDVCERQPGADDNASGVAGLIELVRMLSQTDLSAFPYRIDFVAYCLEEPPYFGTELMGSYQHAQYLHNQKFEVFGMVALEMIGYFSDEPNSQRYPLESMAKTYGTVGDYIATATKLIPGKFVNRFAALMSESNIIKHHYYKAPKQVDIVGMSDHLNYWKFKYSACMVTDTSYLRNPNYHLKSDTIASLDLNRMTKVVDAVYYALTRI